MALQKRDALEYLLRQDKPVTAKELAVDLDSRASTASELVERMASQGLVTRDVNQRPRRYSLTEAGRKRLAFFQSQDGAPAAPPDSRPNPNPNGAAVSPMKDSGSDLRADLGELRAELGSGFDAIREDLADFMGVLLSRFSDDAESPSGPAPASKVSSRAAALLERADRLLAGRKADQGDGKGKPVHPRLQQCLDLRVELGNMTWPTFGRRRRVEGVLEDIEKEIPPEVAASAKRLCELEAERDSWLRPDDDRARRAEEIRTLRAKLGLPAVAESQAVPVSERPKLEA